MTRKMALLQAISILEQMEPTEDCAEVHRKLVEIVGEMPFTSWSRETILDTLEQFSMEHGRNPTVSDLRRNGMTAHPVIKKRFGVNAKEVLQQYFPPACDCPRFAGRSREQWRDFFVEQFALLKEQTAENYNRHRPSGTPTWATVAGMYGCTKWSEWLRFCGLRPKVKRALLREKSVPQSFTVAVTMTELEKEYWRLHPEQFDLQNPTL